MIIQLIAFCGLIIGIIIAYYTKEEMKGGAPFFRLMQLFVLGFLLYEILLINLEIYFKVLIIFVLLITLIIFRNKHKYSLIAYIGFAILWPLLKPELIATLVFLFGLPTGTIIAYSSKFKKRLIKKKLIPYGLFLVISFLVYIFL